MLARTRSGTGNLYRLSFAPTQPSTSITAYVGASSDAKLWHDRLGHLHLDSMKALKNRSLVNDFTVGNISNELELNAISQCEACIKGKSHRAAMPFAATHRATRLLELVHSDLCGPMTTASFNGARYFLTFIDDYSRFTVVKLLKTKDEVMQHFIAYRNWAENVTSHRVKVLRSDNGGEYISNEFDQLLIKFGISRQQTPPYTPEHNGVAERANRTIVECGRSMLQAALVVNGSCHSNLQRLVLLIDIKLA